MPNLHESCNLWDHDLAWNKDINKKRISEITWIPWNLAFPYNFGAWFGPKMEVLYMEKWRRRSWRGEVPRRTKKQNENRRERRSSGQ